MIKCQQHHIWRDGHLYIDEQVDKDLHRTVRVARFADLTSNAT